jgi:predicted O-methyltransferase YrrM
MTINLHQIKSYMRHFVSAKRKGHGVHSPFAYSLCEEVFYNADSFYDFERFAAARNQLLTDQTEIRVEEHGAGSKVFSGSKRKICDIAKNGVSSQKQSEVLYKLINFLKPASIIELGTSVGLNTLYLSGAGKDARVYTVEGSPALSAFAKQLAAENNIGNCEFINGKFDDVFGKLLNTAGAGFVYIDGNHTYEATVRYFRMALEKSNSRSVFIFDDIYWSEGMTKAWDEIRKNDAVTLSIDAFYFGMVFFKEEIKENVRLKIII